MRCPMKTARRPSLTPYLIVVRTAVQPIACAQWHNRGRRLPNCHSSGPALPGAGAETRRWRPIRRCGSARVQAVRQMPGQSPVDVPSWRRSGAGAASRRALRRSCSLGPRHPSATGIDRNPRNLARPPRTGWPAKAQLGNRARNRPMAMRPSRRATLRPMHTWGPEPNAR